MFSRLATLILSIVTGLQSQILPASNYVFTPITLERTFAQDHTWISTLSAQKKITLVSTGDILLARTINAQAVASNDFTFPFISTSGLLSTSDITFVNLETPLTNSCKVKTEGTVFCGSPKWLEGLSFAGIDVVNIANNHSLDAAISGLNETTHLLAQSGFMVTGHQPVYKSVKGTIFAFLGFNDISSTPPDAALAQQIPQARSNSDIVVVQFHWGHEYTHRVSSRQKQLAHTAIDLGADIIIGNHPHWPQPIEIYKGKSILYSHGNFIFDQYWSNKTRLGLVSKITFYQNKIIDLELIPIQIDLTGQPSTATPEIAEQILSEVRPLSVE